MNCAGRKSKVTTVMTRIVAESLTEMSFRASVFSLIVCEVCWCFKFSVSETNCAVPRTLFCMDVAFWLYAIAILL